MPDIYPRFYSDFRCIANRCEDSCCKDWDIDIDSETEKFYNTVSGPLGEKLRSKLTTDEYGERIFPTGCGRCPFWNDDMLCDIYIGLGKEHLSCLHGHDVDFRHDCHTLPYTRNLNWDEITAALAEIEYEGDFTFEAAEFVKPFPAEIKEDALAFMAKVGRHLVGKIRNS